MKAQVSFLYHECYGCLSTMGAFSLGYPLDMDQLAISSFSSSFFGSRNLGLSDVVGIQSVSFGLRWVYDQ